MKLLFKNKTRYTKKVYDEYLRFHQNKYGHRYTFVTIVMIMLLCFCIIVNLKYKNFPTALLLIVALVIFIIYRFFYPVKKVQKELKTEKFEKEKEFTFKFYNDYFEISDEKFYDKIKYRKIYKAFENDSFFYLYINKDHAFLLNKNTFSVGNPSEFMKFIKKKIWFKF